LKGFDYSQPGAYFITVCTHEKRCCLGEIVLGEMKLNAIGKIVNECWLDIPRHFANVELNTHVVMPNHVHGLFVIHPRMGEGWRGRPGGPPAQHAVPLRAETMPQRLAAGSVPVIVRSFKAAASMRVRKMLKRSSFELWQRGYYESAVLRPEEFQSARRYIIENPMRWHADSENVGA
jgi:putative transposase